MFDFMILIEPWAVYVMTARRFAEAPPQNRDRERWQEVKAGSAGQAMGMGWQIRKVGGAQRGRM